MSAFQVGQPVLLSWDGGIEKFPGTIVGRYAIVQPVRDGAPQLIREPSDFILEAGPRVETVCEGEEVLVQAALYDVQSDGEVIPWVREDLITSRHTRDHRWLIGQDQEGPNEQVVEPVPDPITTHTQTEVSQCIGRSVRFRCRYARKSEHGNAKLPVDLGAVIHALPILRTRGDLLRALDEATAVPGHWRFG